MSSAALDPLNKPSGLVVIAGGVVLTGTSIVSALGADVSAKDDADSAGVRVAAGAAIVGVDGLSGALVAESICIPADSADCGSESAFRRFALTKYTTVAMSKIRKEAETRYRGRMEQVSRPDEPTIITFSLPEGQSEQGRNQDKAVATSFDSPEN